MRNRIGRQGFIKIKTFFSLLLVGLLLFIGLSFAMPYYRYYMLKSHTKDLLILAVGNPNYVKEKIMEDAANLKIPLQRSNLDVTMKLKIIKVRATWSETVDLRGYYQKRLDFVMEEDL